MAILSKGCKTSNFEPHNSLKLSFTNIWGLHSDFVEGESPNIHALCETNLDDLIDSDNFSVRCYLSLICKDSIYYLYAWSLSLKEGRGTSFCMGHRKLCRFSLFSISFTSLSVSLFLFWSPSWWFCMVFDSISSNIDNKILSINSSANVFVFGDFNIHHKDWLTYSGETGETWWMLSYFFYLKWFYSDG